MASGAVETGLSGGILCGNRNGRGLPVYFWRADDSWNAGIFPAVFPFLQSANLAAFTAVEFYHHGNRGCGEDFWAVG